MTGSSNVRWRLASLRRFTSAATLARVHCNSHVTPATKADFLAALQVQVVTFVTIWLAYVLCSNFRSHPAATTFVTLAINTMKHTKALAMQISKHPETIVNLINCTVSTASQSPSRIRWCLRVPSLLPRVASIPTLLLLLLLLASRICLITLLTLLMPMLLIVLSRRRRI